MVNVGIPFFFTKAEPATDLEGGVWEVIPGAVLKEDGD